MFQKLAVRAQRIIGRCAGKPGAVLGDEWARTYGEVPHAVYYGKGWEIPKYEGMRTLLRATRLDTSDDTFRNRLTTSLGHGVPALITLPDRMNLLVSEGEQLNVDDGSVSTIVLHFDAVDLVTIVTSFDFLA